MGRLIGEVGGEWDESQLRQWKGRGGGQAMCGEGGQSPQAPSEAMGRTAIIADGRGIAIYEGGWTERKNVPDD